MQVPVDNIYLDALKEFGRQLEERRHSSQWPAHVVSQRASVDVWVVGEVERGDTKPTAAERERIADFLGFPIDTFDKILRQLRQKDAAERGLNVVDMSLYRK